MAEGFITRRGGGKIDGESRVITTTLSGNGATSITLPELIGCKCFTLARAASNLPSTSDGDYILSFSYIGGEILYTYTTYEFSGASSSKWANIPLTADGSFDPHTGKITATKKFRTGSYTLIAYF